MQLHEHVFQVHSKDTHAYPKERYDQLSSLTARYRDECLAACATCRETLADMDASLHQESEDFRPFLAVDNESSKERLLYELRLRLLRYTRRFQGNLSRFGFVGSETYIAVCTSIVHLHNQAMEARDAAIRHDLPVHNLHLEYH